jgi:hypothetical protein
VPGEFEPFAGAREDLAAGALVGVEADELGDEQTADDRDQGDGGRDDGG